MKKIRILGIVTAMLMVFALALTGCGQQGEQNAGATGSEGQNSTITDNGNANNGEATAGPDGIGASEDEANNCKPEMRDGKYVYEVDGTEILCKTNIWDYIDGDVWYRTKMFEDLGYERDDSIEVASRSPGFFRYTEEGRLDALLGAPMNKNSEDFLELRYLNVLGFYGQGGRFVEIIIRYYQDGFATDEPDGPTTPIDLVIMSAYFLEQCQENVDNDYLYVFPNAGDGVYRIYE